MSVSILESHITGSTPQYVCMTYMSDESVPAGHDATSLIELELPSINLSNYLEIPNTDLTGKTYSIDLAFLSFNSESDEFDVRIFTRNEMDLANTAYEVAVYTAIDKSFNDIFERFVIKNDETPITNKLYALIQNYGHVATGPIYIELVYVPI